jgi:hypothetical protein
VRRAKENLTVELRMECGTRPEVLTSTLHLQYQGKTLKVDGNEK